VIFYFSYDFVCAWMVENFGGEDIIWRMCMVAVNFFALLIPCIGFSRNLRLILYILNAVKMSRKGYDEFDKHMRFHDVLNPLIVGGSIDILIIILVPNNLAAPIHIAIAVLIIFLLTLRHIYLISKGKSPRLPLIPVKDEDEEDKKEEEKKTSPINH
jgi:uncharacterized membrane protein